VVQLTRVSALNQCKVSGSTDADQRLASLLLSYYRRRQTDDAGSIVELAIAREDVASYLHINPDTLSRCYSRLRELGVVGRGHRQRLVIRDPARLASLTPLAALIDAEWR
jgi:CRP/FNR family transcriptional regulator